MALIGILLGAAISAFGVYSLFVPLQTSLAIGWIVGILFLLYGIETIAAALQPVKKNVWMCFLGIFSAAAGCIILFSRFQRLWTDAVAAYLFGVCIVLYGIYQIISGIWNIKISKGRAICAIILGVVSVVIGLCSVGHPILTLVSLGYLIGIILISQGFDMILLASSAGKKKE